MDLFIFFVTSWSVIGIHLWMVEFGGGGIGQFVNDS